MDFLQFPGNERRFTTLVRSSSWRLCRCDDTKSDEVERTYQMRITKNSMNVSDTMKKENHSPMTTGGAT